MAKLSVSKGVNQSETFILNSDLISIGRSVDNNIVLQDRSVSRHHAEIRKSESEYLLVDLSSLNGSYVNGKRIKEKILENGDEIKIGATLLSFTEEDSIVLKECGFSESGTVVKPISDVRREQACLFPTELVPSSDIAKISRKPSQRLFILYQIANVLNSATNLSELLNRIMDMVFKVVHAERGFLFLLDKDGSLIPKVVRQPFKVGEGSIPVSHSICNRVIKEKVSILTSDALFDPRFKSEDSIHRFSIRSALCVPLWREDEVIGLIYVDNSTTRNRFTEEDMNLLTAVANQSAIAIERERLNQKIVEKAKLIDNLEKYHSPQVIDMILKDMDRNVGTRTGSLLTAKEIEATILFSDIENFSGIAEKLKPVQVSDLLNRYFTIMTEIIFHFEGTLNKYLGDGILAVFGAPFPKKDDADRAVRAALKMRSELLKTEELNFNTRIGLNTGLVVAGNIGSEQRMEYTVLGDIVNTASRIETMAEPNQILISETTYKKLKGNFRVELLGERSVRGKEKSVVLYEIIDEVD